MNIPDSYEGFRQYWANNQQTAINDYVSQCQSFIPNLLPEQAVQMPAIQLAYILEKRFGQQAFFAALNPQNIIESPVHSQQDSSWIKTVNMVGINVRTIGSFYPRRILLGMYRTFNNILGVQSRKESLLPKPFF